MIEQNGSRLPMHSMQIITQTYQIGFHLHMMPCSTLPGILNGVNDNKATGPDEVTAPIRRSTPWAFIRKKFPFVPTIEMSTLFAFPSKNQLNAQGAVTEIPGTSSTLEGSSRSVCSDILSILQAIHSPCSCRMANSKRNPNIQEG